MVSRQNQTHFICKLNLTVCVFCCYLRFTKVIHCSYMTASNGLAVLFSLMKLLRLSLILYINCELNKKTALYSSYLTKLVTLPRALTSVTPVQPINTRVWTLPRALTSITPTQSLKSRVWTSPSALTSTTPSQPVSFSV